MNKMDDFEASLQVLRGSETDITSEVNDIKIAVASANKRTAIRFQELNQKKFRMPLILGIGLLVLQQLSGISAILSYAGSIFKAAGSCHWNYNLVTRQSWQTDPTYCNFLLSVKPDCYLSLTII